MIVNGALPNIDGVTFRGFKDSSDFEAMARVAQRSWMADGFEFIRTKDEIEGIYAEIKSRDPHEDLIFAESRGETIGFGDCYLEPVDPTTTSLWTYAHVLPEWRGNGVREAIFSFNERRLRERAAKVNARGYFQTWALNEPNDWKDLIMRNGFAPSFAVFEMVRGDLDTVLELPLPKGLEVRPVPQERYRDVWEGMKRAYRGEPWFVDALYDEDHFRAWPTKSEFEPELWQVAWHGDRIVGVVQNFISEEENRTFDKKIGHTEDIWVAEDWRHMGVASALISRSLRLLGSKGMNEATLDVDTDNVSGAKRLYASLGYREVREFMFFRKPQP